VAAAGDCEDARGRASNGDAQFASVARPRDNDSHARLLWRRKDRLARRPGGSVQRHCDGSVAGIDLETNLRPSSGVTAAALPRPHFLDAVAPV
jgi:hypothetical protein